MKKMVTSFKRSHARTAALCVPDPVAGHWQSTPPLETPGHSQACLGQSLWCHYSFLLGPGVNKVLFVPSKSLFTQSCVSPVIESHWPPKSNSLVVLSPFTRSPRLGNLLWALELS